jgi:hypothetical protein
VPGEGFEPPTFGLQIRRDTISPRIMGCLLALKTAVPHQYVVDARILACVSRIAPA